MIYISSDSNFSLVKVNPYLQRCEKLSKFFQSSIISGQVEDRCHDLKQKRRCASDVPGSLWGYTVIVQYEFAIEREEVGDGRGSWAKAGKLQAHRHSTKVELIVGKGSFVSITPPPSLPSPLPMHTQIRFSYISSTAYHVIVETYAQWSADMCAGPGSTGRLRDTWCTEKILLISLLSIFLSDFLYLSFLLCCSFHFSLVLFSILFYSSWLRLADLHCGSLFLIPTDSSNPVWSFHFCNLAILLASFCSRFSFSSLTFIYRPLPRVLKQVARRPKDVFKENKLLDSCTFALAPTFEQIPSHPFASLISPSASRSHSSHVFSFRHFFLSFLPLSLLPPPKSFSQLYPLFFSPILWPLPSRSLLPIGLSSLLWCLCSYSPSPPLQPILKVGFASIAVLDGRIVIYCDHNPICNCQHDLNQSGRSKWDFDSKEKQGGNRYQQLGQTKEIFSQLEEGLWQLCFK